MRVTAVPGGHRGRIEGGFGKSGKFKVGSGKVTTGRPHHATGCRGELLAACLQVFFPGGAPPLRQGEPPPRLLLTFKRFLFDSDRRRMVQ